MKYLWLYCNLDHYHKAYEWFLTNLAQLADTPVLWLLLWAWSSIASPLLCWGHRRSWGSSRPPSSCWPSLCLISSILELSFLFMQLICWTLGKNINLKFVLSYFDFFFSLLLSPLFLLYWIFLLFYYFSYFFPFPHYFFI